MVLFANHIETRCSLLEDILAVYDAGATPSLLEGQEAFERWRCAAASAPLPGASLHWLCLFAAQLLHRLRATHPGTRPLQQRVFHHDASLSAAQTQALLPSMVMVQKTVTVIMGEKLLFYTSVGDQVMTRQHRLLIAQALGLSRHAAKCATINPSWCDPAREFEMQPGMVSPFLNPSHVQPIAALAIRAWPALWEEDGRDVALSLSLQESLLLPLRCLRSLLQDFARQAYPSAMFIEIGDEK